MRRNHTKEKRIKNLQVKLGHGGTLDPMASGVLIIGVGSGTKELSRFLHCTKSYETTVLFGTATDSYDSKGRVIARAPSSHITQAMVEKALEGFSGQIKQRPPIFSALKMNGKKLYEYARSGQELPKEIAERPVTVSTIALTGWFTADQHTFSPPAEEAEQAEQTVAQTVLQMAGSNADVSEDTMLRSESKVLGKRKASEDDGTVTAAPYLREMQSEQPPPLMSGSVEATSVASESHEIVGAENSTDASFHDQAKQAPAAKISLTVSSGFYVRSLCNDLGKAVDSLAHMVQLSRTRQERFELGKNVLDHAELTGDEGVWGPKLAESLGAWQEQPSLPDE